MVFVNMLDPEPLLVAPQKFGCDSPCLAAPLTVRYPIACSL